MHVSISEPMGTFLDPKSSPNKAPPTDAQSGIMLLLHLLFSSPVVHAVKVQSSNLFSVCVMSVCHSYFPILYYEQNGGGGSLTPQ